MAFLVAAFRGFGSRETACTALSAAGHTVVLFGDGAPALAEILAGQPEAVVLEDRLGRMNAGQVRAAMRADPATAAIPVIVCAPRRRTAASGPRRRSDGEPTVDTSQLATQLPTAVAAALAGQRPPRSPSQSLPVA